MLAAIAGAASVFCAAGAEAQLSPAQMAFSALERQLILDCYARSAGGGGRGHGRGRGGGLPPGIQRRVERGGTLPPGIARQYLPPDLSRTLPPVPSGYARQIGGGDVVRDRDRPGHGCHPRRDLPRLIDWKDSLGSGVI